ncbi:MAG: hypothetical protein AAGE61_17250 [Pseudomonadota bacterium]
MSDLSIGSQTASTTALGETRSAETTSKQTAGEGVFQQTSAAVPVDVQNTNLPRAHIVILASLAPLVPAISGDALDALLGELTAKLKDILGNSDEKRLIVEENKKRNALSAKAEGLKQAEQKIVEAERAERQAAEKAQKKKSGKGGKNVVQAIGDAVKKTVEAIDNVVKKAVTSIVNVIRNVFSFISNLFQGVIGGRPFGLPDVAAVSALLLASGAIGLAVTVDALVQDVNDGSTRGNAAYIGAILAASSNSSEQELSGFVANAFNLSVAVAAALAATAGVFGSGRGELIITDLASSLRLSFERTVTSETDINTEQLTPSHMPVDRSGNSTKKDDEMAAIMAQIEALIDSILQRISGAPTTVTTVLNDYDPLQSDGSKGLPSQGLTA